MYEVFFFFPVYGEIRLVETFRRFPVTASQSNRCTQTPFTTDFMTRGEIKCRSVRCSLLTRVRVSSDIFERNPLGLRGFFGNPNGRVNRFLEGLEQQQRF